MWDWECTEVFGAFAAYNSHVYRHHRVSLGLQLTQASLLQEASDLSLGTTDTPIHDGCEGEANALDATLYEPAQLLDSGRQVQGIKAAELLLNLREGRRVSQVALMDIVDSCKSICTQVIDDLKSELQQTCLERNIDISRMEDILSKPCPNPFEEVDTMYRFEKFCVDHLDCQVCVCVCPRVCVCMPASVCVIIHFTLYRNLNRFPLELQHGSTSSVDTSEGRY